MALEHLVMICSEHAAYPHERCDTCQNAKEFRQVKGEIAALKAENAKLREALDHIKRFNCHLGCGAIAAYALGEKV